MGASQVGVSVIQQTSPQMNSSMSIIQSLLHLQIEPNAIVPVSTSITVQGISTDSKSQIKLTITRGNVFHPETQIILNASRLQVNPLDSIEFKIGEYNLFEECSKITFHLHESHTQLMGSYNLVGVKSQIETSYMGNANIFQASCQIHIPIMKHGNIFSPLCKLSIKGDEEEIIMTNNSMIHELVFYLVESEQRKNQNTTIPKDHIPTCHFREHKYGTKKNIAQVGVMINTVKSIIQSHHPLMPINISYLR